MKVFTGAFWLKHNMEFCIGVLLRYGVIVSCIITSFGGVVYFIQHRVPMADYTPVPSGEDFEGVAVHLRSLSGILSGVLAFDGAAIIQLGVCVLIATPILRVAFSALAFLMERDYLYVAITLLVLGIIFANMVFLR